MLFFADARDIGGTAQVSTRFLDPLADVFEMDLEVATPNTFAAVRAGARLLMLFPGLGHAHPCSVRDTVLFQVPAQASTRWGMLGNAQQMCNYILYQVCI